MRETILKRIESEFKMVYQYLDDLKDGFRMCPGESVGTYIAKAEALIELLEIHDCGSTGGSTWKRAATPMCGLLCLEQRFEALKRKYAPKKAKKKNGTIADK